MKITAKAGRALRLYMEKCGKNFALAKDSRPLLVKSGQLFVV
jgi:hypothetical protein